MGWARTWMNARLSWTSAGIALAVAGLSSVQLNNWAVAADRAVEQGIQWAEAATVSGEKNYRPAARNPLTMRGLGQIVIGSNLKDAARLINGITKTGIDGPDCRYELFSIDQETYMVVGVRDKQVHAICTTDPGVETELGLKVGDPKRRLKELPKGRTKRQANHYEVAPSAANAKESVMWFQEDGQSIFEICSGRQEVHAWFIRGGC